MSEPIWTDEKIRQQAIAYGGFISSVVKALTYMPLSMSLAVRWNVNATAPTVRWCTGINGNSVLTCPHHSHTSAAVSTMLGSSVRAADWHTPNGAATSSSVAASLQRGKSWKIKTR